MGKYSNDSFRYNKFDYSESASYSITVLTHKRQNFLGRIENDEIVLSEIGRIVESEWLRGHEIRPDMNITLGAYAILPDHFHAIINIGTNQFNSTKGKDAMPCVPFGNNLFKTTKGKGAMPCVPLSKKSTKNKFGPQSKNLASIIRGFKTSVTIRARKIDPDFKWHKLYYDKIIRDRLELEISTKYINENAKKWVKDNSDKYIGSC